MFEHITLEMSLKPFKQTDSSYIRKVCETVFTQWKPLVKDAKEVCILLWCADGSELLDYRGNLDDTFEWCYFLGGANQREEHPYSEIDPDKKGLHTRNYLYIENPPQMTYQILKEIVRTIKIVGNEILEKDKTILVGETVDPGPEFAISDFKYNRHNEICPGQAMGKNSMVCANSILHADDVHYASFPEGIPEGLPFGTFLGRQAQCFLTDLGFDYLWLSNGLGFGRETWDAHGAVFDGKHFNAQGLESVKNEVVEFWSLFRKECPNIPVQTRGTNLSLGIDMATDGVPLSTIYAETKNLLPPPNSPWAAINFDFGLELMGHMSRIAELPGNEYMFRYYLHDPWWVNSPWYDRYGGQPHDIYLPGAVSRIDENGCIGLPTHFAILSIDNSFGEMPESCVVEPLPHFLKAKKDAPDSIGPLLWLYPFTEYSTAATEIELAAMYAGDFFIRGAINNGTPLNQVISSENFSRLSKDMFTGSIIITPVPFADTMHEQQIIDSIKCGLKVVLYGNLKVASERVRTIFSATLSDEVTGVFDFSALGENKGKLVVDDIRSGGGLNVKSESVCNVDCFAKAGEYAVGIQNQNAVWVQTVVSEYAATPGEITYGESLLRYAISKLGLSIRFTKKHHAKPPVLTIHRHDNSYMYAVYAANTVVETNIKTPLGAPILTGYETEVSGSRANYRFPKADHRECRVFVDQNAGIVGAKEVAPVSAQFRRRIEVFGLNHATVRLFGEEYCKENIECVLNSHLDFYFVGDPYHGEYKTDEHGTYYEIKDVTGSLVFSMPHRKIYR